MLDTLKSFHQVAETAKARIAAAEAEAAHAVRHIEALAGALTDAERAGYEAWLKAREEIKEQGK